MTFEYYLNESAALAKIYRAPKGNGAAAPTYWSVTGQRWIRSTTFLTQDALQMGVNVEGGHEDVSDISKADAKREGAIV